MVAGARWKFLELPKMFTVRILIYKTPPILRSVGEKAVAETALSSVVLAAFAGPESKWKWKTYLKAR
jgi:hypothetical protein